MDLDLALLIFAFLYVFWFALYMASMDVRPLTHAARDVFEQRTRVDTLLRVVYAASSLIALYFLWDVNYTPAAGASFPLGICLYALVNIASVAHVLYGLSKGYDSLPDYTHNIAHLARIILITGNTFALVIAAVAVLATPA